MSDEAPKNKVFGLKKVFGFMQAKTEAGSNPPAGLDQPPEDDPILAESAKTIATLDITTTATEPETGLSGSQPQTSNAEPIPQSVPLASNNPPVTQADESPQPKSLKFLQEKKAAEKVSLDDSGNGQRGAEPTSVSPPTPASRQPDLPTEPGEPKKPSLLPGSDGEHKLQEKYGAKVRAINFYEKQMLNYLAPVMKDFIARQEFLFVGTADRHGECDCTSKLGKPGFIRVLSDNYLMYPEFRGNGIYANAGNMTENPHIAMLMVDFTRDTVGLHVNGKARTVENDELRQYADKLPTDVIEEINLEGKKCPERWVMVEVEEAYIQCSKHIPLLKRADKAIDWGTDSVAAKGGDYFQLQDIPLYDRVGGDKAMEVAVDLFYRKVLEDDLVSKFFEDVDMDRQRLKQKNFLSMAFGGPYKFSGLDLRKAHQRLVEQMGLTDAHFDRVLQLFKESLEELNISDKEVNGMLEILGSARDDILTR